MKDAFDNATKIANIEKEVAEIKPNLHKNNKLEHVKKTKEKFETLERKLETILNSLEEKNTFVEILKKKKLI